MAMEKKPTALHWFRKNLRLHDNPALCEALKGCDNLFALYILPPFIPDANISANRWNFLIECLEDLDSSLKSLGSHLLVVQGYPAQVIPSLLKNLHVTKLTFERESEPFGKQRDAVIAHLAESVGVEVVSCTSHTLYDVDQVTELNGNETPVQFHEFLDVISKIGPPEHPVATVNHGMLASLSTKGVPFQDQNIPSVEDLGIEKSKVTCKEVWHGGEAEALRKLDSLLKEIVHSDFHSNGGASKLSPYLRFGCLSPRTLYHSLSETYLKVKHQAPPLSLFNLLLQRDFYFTLGSNNPTLHQMQNNPVCLQIKWKDDSMAVEKWKMGKTGFPFIDAIMRQLRLEGWISDIARHVVGSFLTRGCMWLSWEEGFKVFGEMHLDAEWSLDAGSWLSFSGSIFDQQNLTILCPVESGKMIDPTGNYTRKYVPEVRGLPNEYVFEPWKAPQLVQKAAACLVGKDYPLPLADHREQRRVCAQRLKKLAKTIGTSRAVDARGHTSMHLFRKDLRLHDNPTLRSCLEGSGTFYPVYILDTEAARQSKISANRWNFLLECLHDLDSQLTRLGSRLFVVRGRDVEVLPKLLSEWGVSRLSFETDSEPFGAQRDAVVRKIAEDAGIEVLSKTSHTLYEPGQILHANQGVVPMLYEDFVRVVEDSELIVPLPVGDVGKQAIGGFVTPVAINHHAEFGVPELNELGMKDSRLVTCTGVWKGGEQEALKRVFILEGALKKNDFEKIPLNSGSILSSGTHLSPYLRFGCLSPRVLWHFFTETYEKAKGKSPPTSFYQPLLLREFFFLMAASNPGLHKMENNPLSVQFPWEENPEGLRRWKLGTTGFPWIDAVMRQLRVEGWIPNVARLAVGCFLTRGCLWINWEEGYKVFDELQLDAEWSLNVGNWLWLSGSTFVKEHIPWLCPVEVGKKIDPSGEYVRKYVPEVRRLPLKYLFEPWKAPMGVQKRARCIVGEDYPEPVADHIEQRRICVERLNDMCISLDISGHRSLHWFRKDLRLHDNPSLSGCLANSKVFYGVYVLECSSEGRMNVSPNRWEFLLQSLRDLDNSLVQLGSRLFVIKGRPVDILPSLFKEWDITRLSFEPDCEPDCKARDMVITNLAQQAGIEVINRVSRTLYDPETLLMSAGGRVPLQIDAFKELVLLQGRPEMPVATVDRKQFGSCTTPVGEDHNKRFGVPTLEEIVLHKPLTVSSLFYGGGEREALLRLEKALQQMKINDFCEPHLTASSLMPSEIHLSPYLRLGCLSPRLFYQRITQEYIKAKTSNPPQKIFNKLLWREFFFTVGSQLPESPEMVNNPLSLQIPWEESAEYLERWKQGMTGFPWIDAIMRQLRSEGWIHDVARRAVGSFLTRGCLWINWEEGFKVFDEFQLDAERSLNSGNWLWLSGSTYVREHIPWLCPVEVGKKIDPTGEYVRRYVPEVRNLPTEYVFEPWLAPRDLQMSCCCVIGQDYPSPIVDHVQQRAICVQRLRDLVFSLTAADKFI